MNKLLFLFLLTTMHLASAQKVPIEKKGQPRVWMFVQKNLHARDLLPHAGFFIRNRVFHHHRRYVSPLKKKKWELTFIDNFDSLDTKKWRNGHAWGEFHPNSLSEYYAANQVNTSGGFLYLNGAYQPRNFLLNDSEITIPYGTGLISSDKSFTQKYGYFEIRCKTPLSPASWAAFWLTGNHSWPPEIDIFEMYGKKTGRHIHKQYSTTHFGKAGQKSRGSLSRSIWLPKDTDTSFHVYACKWTQHSIKFYTDGILISTQKVNKWLRYWMSDEMNVIICNGFEPAYLQYLPKDFKNTLVVDWVRVYRRL